jgi:hypothetical protein
MCKIKFVPSITKGYCSKCKLSKIWEHQKLLHLGPRCVKCAGDHMTNQCHRKYRSSDVQCVLCATTKYRSSDVQYVLCATTKYRSSDVQCVLCATTKYRSSDVQCVLCGGNHFLRITRDVWSTRTYKRRTSQPCLLNLNNG